MRIVTRWTFGAAFLVVLAVTAFAHSGKEFVVTDDCDPNAAHWLGGCLQESGEVSRAEFAAANASRFPGHPSWRIVPPYVGEQEEDDIRVENTGGRPHTFTEVARFGGGYIAGLNTQGVTLAPEVRSQTRTARYRRPRRPAPPCWLQEPSCASKSSRPARITFSVASIRGCGRRSRSWRTTTTSSHRVDTPRRS